MDRSLGYLKAGWSISQVAEKMGKHKAAISMLAMKATELGEDGETVSSPGDGRKNLERFFREEEEILQKAGYRSRHATRSIFSLSKKMKLQKLEFNTSHLHWTSNMCSKAR